MKRSLLLPFTPLWAAGSAWKNRGFDRHPERAQHLQRPVISIGSLSAGGAGKTPFVIALGKTMQQHGMAIDVLSRGYGRNSVLAQRVDSASNPETSGDEPLLIARALGVPVYVAAQRIEAGRLAEADSTSTIHLLDDGFQHRQLARTVDIVLVTQQDIEDTLLPAGDLREPLTSLHRASILVVREDEADRIRPTLERLALNKPVWTIGRSFEITEGTASSRPLAFCGIARPHSFRAALASSNITPAGFAPLRDHQRYDAKLIERLQRAAKTANASGYLTTAKDAVKLTPDLRNRLQPLAIADITVHLRDEAVCIQALQSILANSLSA